MGTSEGEQGEKGSGKGFMLGVGALEMWGTRDCRHMSCSEVGEGIQFAVKEMELREGKWVAGRAGGTHCGGVPGWPWSCLLTRERGGLWGTALAWFTQSSDISKMPSSPLKESSGFGEQADWKSTYSKMQ